MNGFVVTVVQSGSKLTALVTMKFFDMLTSSVYRSCYKIALYVSYYERQKSNKLRTFPKFCNISLLCVNVQLLVREKLLINNKKAVIILYLHQLRVSLM